MCLRQLGTSKHERSMNQSNIISVGSSSIDLIKALNKSLQWLALLGHIVGLLNYSKDQVA